MIGDECPECGKRLHGATCSCGWRAERGGVTAALTRTCMRCEKARAVEVLGVPSTYACEHCGAISGHFCQKCGTRSAGTTSMEDGRRLCPSCRVEASRDAASVRMDVCAADGCRLTVAQHIGKFKAHGQAIAARVVRL